MFSLNKSGGFSFFNYISLPLLIAIVVLLLFPLKRLFAFSQDHESFSGTWKGIEFIGLKEEEINKIKEAAFIQLGTPFEKTNWFDLNQKYKKFNQIKWSFLAVGGMDFYLILEAKESKDISRDFRKISKKQPLNINLPIELERLLNEWSNRSLVLFKQGNPSKEFYKDGYLDADDPLLHNLAISLSKLATKKNDILLRVLFYSSNDFQRSKAAELLSWSKEEKNVAFILEKNLLNDPSEGVRNNLARSMSFMLKIIENYDLKKTALNVFCNQITYPVMTDQNKGLSIIQSLIRDDVRLKEKLVEDQVCKNRITSLSQTSVLPNVGEIATQILDMLRVP